MKNKVKPSEIYLGRSAPLVSLVVLPVVVNQSTATKLGALLTALSKGLSSEGSQGLLKTIISFLAEILLERQIYYLIKRIPSCYCGSGLNWT